MPGLRQAPLGESRSFHSLNPVGSWMGAKALYGASTQGAHAGIIHTSSTRSQEWGMPAGDPRCRAEPMHAQEALQDASTQIGTDLERSGPWRATDAQPESRKFLQADFCDVYPDTYVQYSTVHTISHKVLQTLSLVPYIPFLLHKRTEVIVTVGPPWAEPALGCGRMWVRTVQTYRKPLRHVLFLFADADMGWRGGRTTIGNSASQAWRPPDARPP